MIEAYNPYLGTRQMSSGLAILKVFSYNTGRNSKKCSLKEHMGEIKGLVNYQLKECLIHPFCIGFRVTHAFVKW